MTSIPEISVDAQVLARRLCDAKPGEVIPYQELCDLVKRDVQKDCRYLLDTARKIAQREKSFVFASVSRTGLKRLDDAGIVSVGEQAVGAIHRSTRRAARRLACADYSALPPQEKVRHNTTASLLGAMELATKPTRVKELALAVNAASDKLPTAKVLELFAK
jgi:hypothetical protein